MHILGIRIVKLVAMFLFIATLTALSGCSDSKQPTDPITEPENVNEYLLDLPTWDDFSQIEPDTVKEGDTSVEFDYVINKIRKTTPCSITRTPEKIVTYSPGSEILYIGSLIQGKSYLGGLGSMEELPIRQRAPLSISIDLLFGDNYRVVENPDLASVRQAIGELISAANAEGHVAGSSIFFNQTTSHSFEQSALSLGISVNYLAASVKSSLDWESTSETNTITAYFTQKMFTTSMVLPQRPADLFSEDFTRELLDEQIDLGRVGYDNLPVFVSSISWGRMMMLTMTSSYSEKDMKAALRAKYAGVSADASFDYNEVIQNSEVQLVTVGGDQSHALEVLRTGELKEFFNSDATLTSAVPISYTLRNLGDNSVAKVSETTSYDIVEYEAMEPQYFGNEYDWRTAALSSGMKVIEWNTSAANIALANEVDTPPGKNAQLGMILTFEADTTGLPFSFFLENTGEVPSGQSTQSGLAYWDDEGFPEGTISIGDINTLEDDDFDIVVTTNNILYAIAVEIGHNVFTSDEFLEIYRLNDIGEQVFIKNFPASELGSFIGIISPIPINILHFEESIDGDDIFIRNLRFGILE